MSYRSFRLVVCILLFSLVEYSVSGQDSVLTSSRVAEPVDTIIIRLPQEPIEIITRGVLLINPGITFHQTKPVTEKEKKFRMPSFWEKHNEFDLQLSEVAFVNWNAGGENAFTLLGRLYFERNYKFRFFKWNNLLELRFGLNAQEGRQWRKTDDAIRFSSRLDYQRDTLSNWYYSANAKFNTQFADGFRYPDRSQPISRFMAPGYVFVGGGASYIPKGKKLTIYLSPVTFRATYVLDQTLANQGAFGVKEAVRDEDGNILIPGQKEFRELGFLISNDWEYEILKNVVLVHRLVLFANTLNNFGNIDIDWQLNTEFKVNKYISASLLVHLIYDDDIKFDRVEDENGFVIDPGGARVQFRQQLGVGINYKF